MPNKEHWTHLNRVPTMNHKRKTATGQLSKLFFGAASLAVLATPAHARDLSPEFSSRVWVENETEVAAVCVNGKELITFRAKSGSGSAAEEAEDLSAKLQDLVADKNFDATQLLPGHDGDKAVIKLTNGTAVTFSPLGVKKDPTNAATDSSLKLVNAIRLSMGAPTLPSTLGDATKMAMANKSFSGQASWYGPHFHGRKTSDGHRFDMNGMTAAHRNLPFGTKLLVMNRRTGDSCVVEVNDRGPFIGNRVLDLSKGAAKRLNMIGSGVAMVDCLVLGSKGNN
jgi:rare lipoprotein A